MRAFLGVSPAGRPPASRWREPRRGQQEAALKQLCVWEVSTSEVPPAGRPPQGGLPAWQTADVGGGRGRPGSLRTPAAIWAAEGGPAEPPRPAWGWDGQPLAWAGSQPGGLTSRAALDLSSRSMEGTRLSWAGRRRGQESYGCWTGRKVTETRLEPMPPNRRARLGQRGLAAAESRAEGRAREAATHRPPSRGTEQGAGPRGRSAGQRGRGSLGAAPGAQGPCQAGCLC